MAAKEAKGRQGHNSEDIMEAIRTLATAVQQQQEQIEGILNVLGGGGDRHEIVDAGFGSAAEQDGGENPEDGGAPEYPYKLGGHDQARVKLVDLWFNTPREKLPELTETPRMAVTPTAYVEAMNEYIENMSNGKYEPLDSIYIRRKDMRMKSVSRKSGMEAMAFSQIQEEKKEIEEGQQAGF